MIPAAAILLGSCAASAIDSAIVTVLLLPITIIIGNLIGLVVTDDITYLVPWDARIA